MVPRPTADDLPTRYSTRRSVLQSLGLTTLAGLAGCLGGDGDGDGETTTTSTTRTTTETPRERPTTTTTSEGTSPTTGEETTTTGEETTTTGEETTTTGEETTTTGEETTTTGEETTTTDGDGGTGETTTFVARVENVSTNETLQVPDGTVPVPLSPGVFAAHTGDSPLFTPDEMASPGLEALAEDGDPSTLASAVEMADGVLTSGTFTTPTGASAAGPAGPGDVYEFRFEATAADDPALSLATMFVQSNDLFYAPDVDGIALFEDGEPVSGDRTAALELWDAGTEVNQQPGVGTDQAPRQAGPNTGETEGGVVQRIEAVDDGYDYPATADVVALSVAPEGMDGS